MTEEGQLLAEIQGDSVVDYDIDKYISRLDEVSRMYIVYTDMTVCLSFRSHLFCCCCL